MCNLQDKLLELHPLSLIATALAILNSFHSTNLLE